MENQLKTNLMIRVDAHARHQKRQRETKLFLLHFHTTTPPQVVSHVLGTTDSHSRQFFERLEHRKLIRCVRGAHHSPLCPTGRLWLLTSDGVRLAESFLEREPHYYPTSLDSVRLGQVEHDLEVQRIAAKRIRWGANIVSTDFVERQKNGENRHRKLPDVTLSYRGHLIKIEYETTRKNEREMDQVFARAAQSPKATHTVWVVENKHRIETW
jgi:hypothetical protein